MKILITGSKGLIGTALKRKFRSLGIDVVGCDTACDPHQSDYGDILDPENLFHKIQGVDGVIHLAAVSRVIFGEKFPDLCWKTNVEGTKNVIAAAKESPACPWMIYASSREVYGEQGALNVAESARLAPVNIYGESKVAAESAVNAAKVKGLRGTIVRFSNVFGSVHDHHDRVVPAFCLAAANGENIRVDGKENLFDFTYIDDVVQGVLAVVFKLQSGRELPPIHFTSGVATSLGEIANFAKELSSHNIEIVEAPSRSFDVAKFSGNTKRAEDLLGWSAAISVQRGMRRLIREYQVASLANRTVYV
ncbi:MAG: NAD-dependent epimerase/dehydratase family protein [Chlamydiales bacterium]